MAIDSRPFPGFADKSDYARARELFARVGYTSQELTKSLKLDDGGIKEDELPLVMERTKGGSPVEQMVRLFLANVPVKTADMERALSPMPLETWARAGLLKINGDETIPLVRMLPFHELTFVFDLSSGRRSDLPADYVMGIGSSSLTLAQFTIRRPSRLTLDLGTGCGILGLLAAKHSERVVAVDRNPRATAITAFNAALNGFEAFESLEGDLFEPVQNRSFDLVVSNPPFVISPRSRFIYRDSGLEGDQITQRIFKDVAPLLAEGGYCQLITNWALFSDRDNQARLSEWFDGTGCDAWVLTFETRDVATYASTWIKHTEGSDPDQMHKNFADWMAYYRANKIEGVGGGIITVRKASGRSNWVSFAKAPDRWKEDCGEAVARHFTAVDYLTTHTEPAQVLATRFMLAPDVGLDQHCEPGENGWAIADSQLLFRKGMIYTGNTDPVMAGIAVRCTGMKALGEILQETAAMMEWEVAKVAHTAVPIVRELVKQGFLLPT